MIDPTLSGLTPIAPGDSTVPWDRNNPWYRVPAQIGTCPLCDQAVYEHAPISTELGSPAHVACVAHRRLDRQPYLDDAPVI